ncbi:MAG: PASTA domain-containing protein [Sedimentisphaerales bacterium]
MRKTVLFLLVLFMAVPAMAVSTVTISCAQGSGSDINAITVSYHSDVNLIRAFGLDINVGGGANITKVVPLDANYRIYPGEIVIVDGNVIDYNKPYAPGSLPGSSVTVEMGSLYTTDSNYASDANAGYGKKPGLGTSALLKFYVDQACCYKVDVNAKRGGIVMEDPTENPSIGSPLCSGCVVLGCTVPNVVHMTEANAITAITTAGFPTPTVVDVNGNAEPIGQVASQSPVYTGNPVDCGTAITINVASYCMKATHPDYAKWVLHNKPKCWCYAKQCHGDADGLQQGLFWVSNNDKALLVTYLNKFPDPPPPSFFAGACADFTHSQDGGLFWVSNSDKTILTTYLNKVTPVPADCSATYINFWCKPGSTSLGCP